MNAAHIDQPTPAFSLVEILVAVSVFAILLILLIQVLSGVVRATSVSQRQLEARENIQAAMGAFEQDCGGAVTQFGVPIFVAKNADGNARLAFLTRNRGPNVVTNTRFLAVDYQRHADGSLVRVSAPVVWEEMDLTRVAVQNGAATNVSPLAENIVRFEVVAELADGRVVALDSPEIGRATFVDGAQIPHQFRAMPFGGEGTNAVKAITVSVAALDRRSREILGGNVALDQLAAALNGGSGRTSLERWSSALQGGGLASFPRPVQETIQFAERTYTPR